VAVTLYHLEISHYNEKVRFALAYKGIEHTRRTAPPGFHGPVAMWLTRSTHRRLPVIDIDGKRIGNSSAIIAALEDYAPDPSLYPADAAERARALELEAFFDSEVGPAVRAFNFAGLFAGDADPGPILAPGSSPRFQRFLSSAAPVMKPIVRADYDVHDATRQRQRILDAVDRLESEVRPSGYLAGDMLTVADIAGATLLTPVVDAPGREHMPAPLPDAVLELRAELMARPGGQWAREIFAKHRLPTGSAATASV
jgi:glutathione S-transferase